MYSTLPNFLILQNSQVLKHLKNDSLEIRNVQTITIKQKKSMQTN